MAQPRLHWQTKTTFEKLLAHRHSLSHDALAHTLLNYGKTLKRQGRVDQAINSFKELIVLSQSNNTALEIVRQAALELSDAQVLNGAEFQREKDSVEEEKKLFTAKMQAETDLLIAEQATLLIFLNRVLLPLRTRENLYVPSK